MPPRPRTAEGIEHSSWPCLRHADVRRADINALLLVHPSVDQVKIFVQDRISRPINGSKLIFHMRMYLYDTSRNIQEPWPPDLYFMVHRLQTLAKSSRLRFLSKVESQDLLMVASWYFIWGCISVRPAGTCSHDLTYISQSTDFVLWPDYQGYDFFVQGWNSRPVIGSKLIFHIRMYLYETSRNIQEPWPPDLYFMVCWHQTGRFSMVKIFVIGRFLNSADGSKLIFY